MKERTLKNCSYKEAENLLLSRGVSKPLLSVEAWRSGFGYPLGGDVGSASIRSGGVCHCQSCD